MVGVVWVCVAVLRHLTFGVSVCGGFHGTCDDTGPAVGGVTHFRLQVVADPTEVALTCVAFRWSTAVYHGAARREHVDGWEL